MIQFVINLITDSILKKHIQMKVLIAKIVRDPTKILRFCISDNFPVILIDNFVIVDILPNGVSTYKYSSVGSIS
ncbi:hypothetical protein D3C87_1275350 [compost metagenome]